MTPPEVSEVEVRAGARLTARSVAIEEPADLLDGYAPGGFVWLDGDHGFVASGVAAVVAPGAARDFLATVEHAFAGDAVPPEAGPRAVGALPFAGSGNLVVPAVLVGRDERGRMWRTVVTDDRSDAHTHSDPRTEPGPGAASGLPPSDFRVTTATTRDDWRAMVRSALVDIDTGALRKVVLARAVHVDADHPFDVRGILAHLRRSQPGCVVYADRGFVGASPELLVRKRGAAVLSRPLAGTGTDTAALVRSAKDGHEHRLVVDAVVRALCGLCSEVLADGPSPLELADVSHLATTVTGATDDPATTIADLVAALHPTPAVGGTPSDRALAALTALEPTPRGRYAGPCGWTDANGDGEFVVALRGGVVDGRHALIHAGAGIVSGSDPDAEWTETQQKLTPMLQALVRP